MPQASARQDIELQLQSIKKRIAELEETSVAATDVSQHFHLGMVGSGKHTARLNKGKIQALDKTIDHAVRLTSLYRKRDSLIDQLEVMNRVEQQQPTLERIRDAQLQRLRSMKPGMQCIVFTGNIVTVKRVNKATITTANNVKYRYEELSDVVLETRRSSIER